ncbi:hypothetical protein Zmor_011477 [Zophobas morio]|uniref:Uncharacterized protein n=1 Tax=Zophobas morio TaxID=2755281 RepID=A0AA38IRL1_9CUCU|nr:hypothetical protein Zmor_011477 [Zophobas morio]
MTEKFNLKTATSLLPLMNGNESVTKQLIDAIELYDSLLDNDGKQALTNYVLKARLTESAKIRLKNVYASNALLVQDMRRFLLTTKSVASLSTQLVQIRQNNMSIEDFRRKVENLLVELTIAQADGNSEALQILRETNEKLAINAFASGLQNPELHTIIKARKKKQKKTNLGHCLIGLDGCNIYDAVDVLRCYKCNGFNRSVKTCKKTLSCPKCSKEHELKECKAQNDQWKCINCSSIQARDNLNTEQISHASWDYENCSFYKNLIRKIKSEVFGLSDL